MLLTKSKEVIYYETMDGKSPFREWIYSLKESMTRNKIRVRIDRVSLGNLGHCRSVGQGVTELKIDYGPGYRVYFGQKGASLIVLLWGGDKSSQKRDIKIAQDYWDDYRRRYG